MITRRNFTALLAAASSAHGVTPVSPITNRWGEAKTSRIEMEEIFVFKGRVGAAYSHHPQILFHRGRLFLTWSLGAVHEDYDGQQMVVATSDDGGRTWSSERVINAPLMDPGSIYTARGLRAYKDSLIAYYGHYAYTPLGKEAIRNPAGYGGVDYRKDPKKWVHYRTFCDARVSTDRGVTWGKPVRVVDQFVPNLRPFATRSGRLIMPGNIMFAYTDDPAGLRGWKRVGIPRMPKWAHDDSEGFHKVCGFRDDPFDYCEGSFYQTDGEKIHMLLRIDPLKGTKHNGLLAVTESSDNGRTWSEVMLTSYSDSACRFQFGRLPDVRYFGLSCPKPRSGRTPLVLALSKDGVVFDRHYILGDMAPTRARMAGNHKGGTYGYASCDIAEGRMFITWSRNKEDVCFGSIPLRALEL